MPLSPAAPREHIHTRTVTCRGYRRKDGLWDIEGHLVDVKRLHLCQQGTRRDCARRSDSRNVDSRNRRRPSDDRCDRGGNRQVPLRGLPDRNRCLHAVGRPQNVVGVHQRREGTGRWCCRMHAPDGIDAPDRHDGPFKPSSRSSIANTWPSRKPKRNAARRCWTPATLSPGQVPWCANNGPTTTLNGPGESAVRG